jgi:hypothetical protein
MTGQPILPRRASLSRLARARSPRAAQEVHAAGGGLVVEAEEIAAQAAHVGLRHREHGVDRHRSVRDGAAGFQDVDAGHRGERVRGGDHAVEPEGQGTMRIADLRHVSLP